MSAVFDFVISVLGLAVNVVLYVDDPNPWSLGGAVFCGSLAVFYLTMAARE